MTAFLSTALGTVAVHTTQQRGATPEELADRALDKIVHVSSDAPPAIRAQAEAFRDNIRKVLVFYLTEAVRANNVTLANKFQQAGHPELIPILDI